MKKLVLSAGMLRSGSTWLYNAIRLLLSTKENIDLGSGWVEDLNPLKNHETVLLKIHDFKPELANKASIIFYSYRDLRDVMASSRRKYASSSEYNSIKFAKHHIEEDIKWREKAVYLMRYEEMIVNPVKIINNLTLALDIQIHSADAIVQEIKKLSYESEGKKKGLYNTKNLFHKGHITDGRHGSWKGCLSEKFIAEIEHTFGDWMRLNKYL